MFAERYTLGELLGKGTYGEVRHAVDTHLDDREVALMLLNPTRIGEWEWEESSVLARLRSQYVLEIYNADIFDGVPYLATELAEQGSLESGNGLPRLWVPEVLAIVGCAARGLAMAHDYGIVHRDVKPANIFWGCDRTALVGDFGLAHSLDRNGEAPPHGTPATLAPEVAAGGKTTPRSDIWSLGATAYWLLTGIYPHENNAREETRQALLEARISADPTPIGNFAPHVSRRLANSIHKAIDRYPAKRHASMTDFDNSLGPQAAPKRSWRERAPHRNHIQCWESSDPGALNVCMIPTENETKVDLVTHRQPKRGRNQGDRILRCCKYGVYKREAPERLRAIFGKLGN